MSSSIWVLYTSVLWLLRWLCLRGEQGWQKRYTCVLFILGWAWNQLAYFSLVQRSNSANSCLRHVLPSQLSANHDARRQLSISRACQCAVRAGASSSSRCILTRNLHHWVGRWQCSVWGPSGKWGDSGGSGEPACTHCSSPWVWGLAHQYWE